MNSIFYIDGNNLLHLSKRLSAIQKKDKQGSREALISYLLQYFRGKKCAVTVFFDGFESNQIHSAPLAIRYSNKHEADDDIRKAISSAKNPRLITLVTSDGPLAGFGRKCSCTILSSEDFDKMLFTKHATPQEDAAINSLQNQQQEFIDLFTRKRKS